MPGIGDLMKFLTDYGGWGLLLVVVIYIIINGEILFRYGHKKPRNKRDK